MNLVSVKSLGCVLAAAAVQATLAADAPKYSVPAEYAACTNLAQNGKIRGAWQKDMVDAAKASDFAKLAALVDALAKKPVQGPVLDVWLATADAVVDAGLAQKKKKPEEQKEVMAGFREGGTTFGLWQGKDGLDKAPDQAYFSLARNLLLNKMPQKLSLVEQSKRNARVLDLANKAGTATARQQAVDAVKAFALSAKPVTAAESNVVASARNDRFRSLAAGNKWEAYAAFAREYAAKRADLMTPGLKAEMLAREMIGWDRADLEKPYLKVRDEFMKLPLDGARFNAVRVYRADVRNAAHVWFVLSPLVDKRQQLFKGNTLGALLEFWFNNACDRGDFDGACRAYDEIKRLDEQMGKLWKEEEARVAAAREIERISRQNNLKFTPYVRNQEIERPAGYVWRCRDRFVRTAMERAEYARAIPELEKSLNPRDGNATAYFSLACSYWKIGKLDKALATYELVIGTNTMARADAKAKAAYRKARLQATSPEDLVKRLNALRGDKDDAQWFDALRTAGLELFNQDNSRENVPYLKAVIAASRELVWPDEKVEYKLTWLPDAPTTAEGALKAGVFDKLACENRMGRYQVFENYSRTGERAILKSKVEKPNLAADKPGKEAAVCACYDANGLHVYMKFNDPDAWKARDGIASGLYFEYDFQPGGDSPWHWNMVTRADEPNVDQGAVWDAPRKGFKVGAEYIKQDAVSTENCHVFHLYVPWILCWNEFPKEGDVWRLVLVAGWAGQFGAMGAGGVHELGRGMHMTFGEIPADVRAKMTKGLLREAVRDYHMVRDKWENASFWADADLGDPAFNDKVAWPFMKDCDALANECCKPDLSDERAKEIFETRLFDLADFRLALDAKRSAYLQEQFFAK